MAKRKVSQVFTASGETVSKPRVKKVRSMLAVSVKKLGELNTPNACPACFYLRARMAKESRKPPFSMPVAGLLSSMDSLQKKLIQRTPELPDFLRTRHHGQELIKVGRLSWTDETTGIELTGEPDLVFQDAFGGLHVCDLKTSKPKLTPASGDKGSFEKIVSIYGAQVNGYKWLLEKHDIGKVKSLSLIYLWPRTLDDIAGGVSAIFDATEVPVSMDTALIPKLLERARKILLGDGQPPMKSTCEECLRTIAFLQLFDGGLATIEEARILENSTVTVS